MSIIKKQNTLLIVTLFFVTFVGHFIFSRGFGLYEDDYVFINLGWTFDQLINHISRVLTSWPSGRPIGNIIPFSIGYLGNVFDSLIPVYFFAYLFITINSMLIFYILKQFSPALISFIGALIYIAFPADTTKILLIHSLGIQTGLTFTLLASLLYLKGMRVIPYLFSLLSLLTYETTWLPLLFMPLLKGDFDRRLIMSWLKHLAIMITILLVVIGIRSLLGEVRMGVVGGADKSIFLLKTASLIFLGPVASAYTFFIRPYTAIVEGDFAVYIIMIVTAVSLAYVFRKLIGNNNTATDVTIKITSFSTTINCDKNLLVCFRLIVVSLLMWMSTYVLSYTHWPAFHIEGRMTSVHIAATVPAALFFAGVVWMLTLSTWGNKKLSFITATLSVYVALLIGWHVVLQNDYATSWSNQKNYWQQIIKLTPDINEGTQIFIITKEQFPETKYISTHSWADYLMLSKIFNTGIKDSSLQPKVNIISPDNTKSFQVKNNKLVRISMRPKPGGGHHAVEEEIDAKKMIVLAYQNNKFTRLTGIFSINNIRIKLSDTGKSTDFEPNALYKLIMD